MGSGEWEVGSEVKVQPTEVIQTFDIIEFIVSQKRLNFHTYLLRVQYSLNLDSGAKENWYIF